MEMVFNKGEHMTKRETIVTFIKDMLRPRTLQEIIDIEMREATLAKMQAEKSLEYAMSVVDYNRQRIRRLQEKLLEIGEQDA
jgi:DNA-directed RNA polymerase subunit F